MGYSVLENCQNYIKSIYYIELYKTIWTIPKHSFFLNKSHSMTDQMARIN